MKGSQVVLGVFFLALVLRLAFLCAKPGAWGSTLMAADESDYHGIAVSLLKGEGFCLDGRPTARRGPGYPGLLTAVSAMFGPQPAAARVANAVLGALLCALIAGVAAAVWGGARAALGAGLLAAGYYPFVQLPPYLMPENLYLPLFVLAAWATWASSRPQGGKRRLGRAAAAGAAWGLAALTRPAGLPFLVLSAAWLAARREWRSAGSLIVCAVAVVAPWTVRNYLVLGASAPVELSTGGNLYLAFGPPGTGGVRGHWNWGSDIARPKLSAGLSEVQRDRELTRLAVDRVKSDPRLILRRIPVKLINLFSPFYATASLPNKALSAVAWAGLYATGLWGLCCSLRSTRPGVRSLAQLGVALSLGTVAMHALLYGVVRYRYPVDALLLVFAGAAIARGYDRRFGGTDENG